MSTKLLLRVLQAVEHLVVGLHRLDEHTVLHGLGEDALHTAVTLPDAARKLAHLPHVEAADEDEDRKDTHGDAGKPDIHLQQVAEGTNKHGQGREHRGQRLGQEIDNVADVLL